jgi:hypothetical protein
MSGDDDDGCIAVMTRSISVRDARKRSDVREVIEISLTQRAWNVDKGTSKTPAKIVYSKRFSARASGPLVTTGAEMDSASCCDTRNDSCDEEEGIVEQDHEPDNSKRQNHPSSR